MSKSKTPENIRELPSAIITQMIVLSTGGFGVVVALAWNEFIKNVVDGYIRPYLGQDGGIWSLFIYAIVITVIAVIVTMQMTKIQKKFEKEEEAENEKIEKRSLEKEQQPKKS